MKIGDKGNYSRRIVVEEGGERSFDGGGEVDGRRVYGGELDGAFWFCGGDD